MINVNSMTVARTGSDYFGSMSAFSKDVSFWQTQPEPLIGVDRLTPGTLISDKYLNTGKGNTRMGFIIPGKTHDRSIYLTTGIQGTYCRHTSRDAGRCILVIPTSSPWTVLQQHIMHLRLESACALFTRLRIQS